MRKQNANPDERAQDKTQRTTGTLRPNVVRQGVTLEGFRRPTSDPNAHPDANQPEAVRQYSGERLAPVKDWNKTRPRAEGHRK